MIKLLLKSYGGSLTAKEIKEHLVPALIARMDLLVVRNCSALRREPFIAVSGGAEIRAAEQEVSDEEELLQRFDETKAPHDKADQIYTYLRTTKKSDLQARVVQHFSRKIQAIAPTRRSRAERVELWFTNEDLKEYVPDIGSVDRVILDEALRDVSRLNSILQHLRFKSHQAQFAREIRQTQPEAWPDIFQQLLLEPNVLVRDELAGDLEQAGYTARILAVVDQALANFRTFPHTFIWLAGRILTGEEADWCEGKISPAVVIERLLLLVDYLTSQAKRREKDEAAYLRKVAGDARELIRRNHYSLFKLHIQNADEAVAQSIYRRALTNEGIDQRTAADLTTIVRARYPGLFTGVATEAGPAGGLLCLKATYDRKRALLRHLIELQLPEVVREMRPPANTAICGKTSTTRPGQAETAGRPGRGTQGKHAHGQADGSRRSGHRTDRLRHPLPVSSNADKVEEYILLGPWESDPNRNILSYQAPSRRRFTASRREIVNVELPMHTGQYEILSIEPIPPDLVDEIGGSSRPPPWKTGRCLGGSRNPPRGVSGLARVAHAGWVSEA